MIQKANTGLASRGGVSAESAFLAFHDVTPDGFMMFDPVRGDAGDIVDLEWTFANKAAGKIIGRDPETLLGKRLLVEMPGNRDEGLFDAYVEVLETGKTWQNEFHYDHGSIKAWFRTTATKSGDGLALSFADISEARAGEERLKNLIDGVLAFVGVLSLDGTLLEANEPAIAAAGGERDQVIGRPFWDCFWWDVDEATKDKLKRAVVTAASGERIRYDAKIRVAGDQQLWIDFQIAPVFNAAGEVTELIPSGVDISERKAAEAHRELLIRELSHRVKNTLATIQSIAGQSVRAAENIDGFRSSFNARLRAIAASHDLLVEFDHDVVPLKALLQGQVLQYAADDTQLVMNGENIDLPGDVAHALGLVLHELATNASKYGALSSESGTVKVSWHVIVDGGKTRLFLSWCERGGPEVKVPTHKGFGSRLIERSLAPKGDSAVIDYDPRGLSCEILMDLE
ncbi:PAS domain S-box-containing protein [Cognatiyoonia koreensis]|uniref:histidine kinase n=1 Tax=Cognatiyoonia koreensis TaxID=364200 RepID=A0A1I0NA96_9RHOB|nr:HWE histidine kinase domain-containing protein [Cognatiyoonia koreensis]SEV97823.1 PAS domain S-box-containing protein [Cognatiyoonia koreensis]